MVSTIKFFLQKDLDRFKEDWNTHLIRKSKNSISPGGRPMSMYWMPEQFKKKNFLIDLQDNDIEMLKDESRFEDHNDNLYDVIEMFRTENNLPKPLNAEHANALYLYFRLKIHKLIDRIEAEDNSV